MYLSAEIFLNTSPSFEHFKLSLTRNFIAQSVEDRWMLDTRIHERQLAKSRVIRGLNERNATRLCVT